MARKTGTGRRRKSSKKVAKSVTNQEETKEANASGGNEDDNDDSLVRAQEPSDHTEPNDACFLEAMEERGEPILGDVEKLRREGIALLFVTVYGAEPNRTKWTGKDGIMQKIKDSFGIPDGTNIEYVLEDVLQCLAEGTQYTGDRRQPVPVG